MLTQVHELSELLFKVISGKINDEADEQAAFFSFDEQDGMPDWDERYFTGGAAGQANQRKHGNDDDCNDENSFANNLATDNSESDLGRTVTSSGKYQNTFTITEIQLKPN